LDPHGSAYPAWIKTPVPNKQTYRAYQEEPYYHIFMLNIYSRLRKGHLQIHENHLEVTVSMLAKYSIKTFS